MILPPSYSFPRRLSFREWWDLIKILITTDTPSKPELPHTDTQPLWVIISGVSAAHAPSFWSSLSSPCYKWAPSGPERCSLWEGLSWVKRTGYNWIMKWEAKGQEGHVCPCCPSHLTPGTSVMYLSKRNSSFKIGSNWHEAGNSFYKIALKYFKNTELQTSIHWYKTHCKGWARNRIWAMFFIMKRQALLEGFRSIQPILPHLHRKVKKGPEGNIFISPHSSLFFTDHRKCRKQTIRLSS